MGRAKFILVLIVLLSICVSVDNDNEYIIAKSQGDWTPEIGEKLHCISTYSWDEWAVDHHSRVTVNYWPELSVESHPLVGVLESWSDIPHPNATFWGGEENISSPFDRILLYDSNYDYGWQGQGQFWFHYVLPDRSPSVYEALLVTLTQGPWNHSISPQYFQDASSYWGYHYSFSHEGFLYNVAATYWIQGGYDISDYYAGVIRNGSVTVFNGTTENRVHMRQIRCSPSGPAIGGQFFYHAGERAGPTDSGEYIQGETDNNIIWDPLFWPEGIEGTINLYLNDSRIVPEQFNWMLYDSTTFNYSVDGLDPGLYNFTFGVRDMTGNIDTSTFILTVLPSYAFERTMVLGGIGIIIIIGAGLYAYNRRTDGLTD